MSKERWCCKTEASMRRASMRRVKIWWYHSRKWRSVRAPFWCWKYRECFGYPKQKEPKKSCSAWRNFRRFGIINTSLVCHAYGLTVCPRVYNLWLYTLGYVIRSYLLTIVHKQHAGMIYESYLQVIPLVVYIYNYIIIIEEYYYRGIFIIT
jgi:hypothetical protein